MASFACHYGSEQERDVFYLITNVKVIYNEEFFGARLKNKVEEVR